MLTPPGQPAAIVFERSVSLLRLGRPPRADDSVVIASDDNRRVVVHFVNVYCTVEYISCHLRVS